MDPTLFIGDILERDTSKSKPPTFSDADAAATGFPAHKKRPRVSAFKQRRQGETAPTKTQPNANPDDSAQQDDFETAERKRIDRENRQRLQDMSMEEIEKERQELMQGLDPSLIQRLLKRANIEESNGPSPFDPPPSRVVKPEAVKQPAPEIRIEDTSAPKQPPPQAKADPSPPTIPPPKPVDEDKVPSRPPPDLFALNQQPDKTHFPAPPPLPDLDPSHPDFLTTLHEKWFPNLPADPSKLAWMAPIPTTDSPADRDSPYYPGQESLPVSALRFDFRGGLLPPRVSRAIPVSKGLHHHGEAPEAAGYTIAELARLARSAVPAQRCITFQTLGRILYRLGKDEWGNGEEDSLASGIWRNVKEGRILESLAEAAIVEGGHRGSRAYATEALWLFEKGGWREQWSGR